LVVYILEDPSTTSDGLAAASAGPDTNSASLYVVLEIKRKRCKEGFAHKTTTNKFVEKR
jgi:hypothetical protein